MNILLNKLSELNPTIINIINQLIQNPNSKKRKEKVRNLPVAALAGGTEELVRVEDHDLVLVRLVDEDAVHC